MTSTRFIRRRPTSSVRAVPAPLPAMRGIYWLICLLTALAFLLASQAAWARSAPESFADLADSLLPAVVNVSTTQTVKADSMSGSEELDDFFNEFMNRQGRENKPRRMTSLGSGFIIDAAGYVVTNNHVIADADEITVTSPRRHRTARPRSSAATTRPIWPCCASRPASRCRR